MKKKTYLIIAIVCIAFLSCSKYENSINDLEKLNLKGKIERVTYISYSVIEKFGELNRGEKKPYSYFQHYNEEGFLVEESGFSSRRLEYNKKNQLVKMYNSTDTTKYKYDDKGLKVEENLYSNQLLLKTKYFYDDNGNEVENKQYSGSGELSYHNKKLYNEKNCIEEKTFGSFNDLMNIVKYKYDNKGNQIEKIIYFNINGEEKIKKDTDKYDDKNNKIEYSHYSNLYGEDYYSGKTVYKKYDSKGNWIESIEYFNNKPNIFITRKIDYYN